MDATIIGLIIASFVSLCVSVLLPLRMMSKNTTAAAIQRAEEAAIRRQEKRDDAALRRQEKLEEYARQDEIARRAEEASRAVIANNQIVVDSNAHVAKAAQATARIVEDKLRGLEDGQRIIHGLVNSQYTDLLRAQLATLRGSFVLINRIITLTTEAGNDPTQEDLDTLVELRLQMDTLRANVKVREEIEDRLVQHAKDGTIPEVELPPLDIQPATAAAATLAAALESLRLAKIKEAQKEEEALKLN